MTNSRRQESCAYNHLATKLIMKYECSFSSYTTAKFAHFRMAFLALGARKCKHYQSRLFLHIPIELLGPVVGRILANLTISKLYRQSKAKISTENCMLQNTVTLSSTMHSFFGVPSSASELGMVKHDKLDHVLDTIIWDFWAESVQSATYIRDIRVFSFG